MAWIKDLKVGARLFSAFALLLFLMVVVGWVGITNMGALDDADTKLYEMELQGVSMIKEVNIDVLEIVRVQLNALLTNSDEQRQSYAKRNGEGHAHLQSHLNMAKKNILYGTW